MMPPNAQFDAQFDFAALALLVVILAYHLLKRRISLFQARLFVTCLVVALVGTVADIASVYTIAHAATVPLWLNYLVNDVYLSVQFMVPLLLLAYLLAATRSLAWKDMRRYAPCAAPAVVAVLALCLLNPGLQWCFYFDASGAYVHGPLHALVYINDAVYTMAMLVVTFVYRRQMTRVQFATLVAIDATVFAGLVFQFLFPAQLLAGFCFSLVILLGYLSFQNPREEVDPLTGLPTRQSFDYNVRRLMRKHPAEAYAIAYFNIRQFKVTNDLYGMKCGDDLLVRLGALFGDHCRGSGTCARFSGDHFVMCAPREMCSAESLLALTDRFAWAGAVPEKAVISFGIYVVDDRALPVGLMCDRARMALKSADRDSKSRFAVYDDALHDKIAEENELVGELEAALRNGQFAVLYQPIYDLASEAVVSAEVLLRWNHPSRDTILPGRFMPLLRQCGLMFEADRFVWETACREMARCEERHGIALSLSTNLSNVHLYNPDTAAIIGGILAERGFDSSRLRLELSEGTYMEDKAVFCKAVQEYRDQGFSVVIDDFGGGYSSLGVFKEAAFNQLKIDMQFVQALSEQGRDAILVESIVEIARGMNLYVIAEGVETAAQVALLRQIGCDAAQGSYLSKPLPAERLEALLVNQHAG